MQQLFGTAFARGFAKFFRRSAEQSNGNFRMACDGMDSVFVPSISTSEDAIKLLLARGSGARVDIGLFHLHSWAWVWAYWALVRPSALIPSCSMKVASVHPRSVQVLMLRSKSGQRSLSGRISQVRWCFLAEFFCFFWRIEQGPAYVHLFPRLFTLLIVFGPRCLYNRVTCPCPCILLSYRAQISACKTLPAKPLAGEALENDKSWTEPIILQSFRCQKTWTNHEEKIGHISALAPATTAKWVEPQAERQHERSFCSWHIS